MSAYVDDVKHLMSCISEYREVNSPNHETALGIGRLIKNESGSFECVGEKPFRDFLYDKGQSIMDEMGGAYDAKRIFPNPDADYEKVSKILDEVYKRLEFELTSGPATAMS